VATLPPQCTRWEAARRPARGYLVGSMFSPPRLMMFVLSSCSGPRSCCPQNLDPGRQLLVGVSAGEHLRAHWADVRRGVHTDSTVPSTQYPVPTSLHWHPLSPSCQDGAPVCGFAVRAHSGVWALLYCPIRFFTMVGNDVVGSLPEGISALTALRYGHANDVSFGTVGFLSTACESDVQV
jgi:hypothetical protein